MHIYFDSCILIYRIEQREPWTQRVTARLATLDPAVTTTVTSELARLECRVRPIALGQGSVLRDYDAFFELAGIVMQALGREVFERATALRATHRLKTPDALHLAAALTAGCDELWTNDHRFDAAAAALLRVVVPADPA